MKKLLSVLGSLIIATTASATVVSCGTNFNTVNASKLSNTLINKIKKTDLGELNSLKPLASTNDGNIFNTDNRRSKKHSSFGVEDYLMPDAKIGTYEIAKVLFNQNGLRFNYDNLFGFKFILSKSDSSDYEMKVISENGSSVVCHFSSNEEIQLSLNSVLDDDAILKLKDGNVRTIINAVLDGKNFDGDLDIVNVASPSGVRTVNVDNKTGKGEVWLYDKSGKYGGYLKLNIEINNYEPFNFSAVGDKNKFYNDRTDRQNKVLKGIDDNFKNTELDPNKHVFLFGFDGLKYDEIYGSYFNKITADHHIYGDYYNQAWESSFGWRTDLTGAISGDSTNIFEMINNAKNNQELYASGNFMWSAFSHSVFARPGASGPDVIKKSFTKENSYIDLTQNKNKKLWLDEAKKEVKTNPKYMNVKIPKRPKDIDDMEFSPNIFFPSENSIMYSALKSQATFDLTMDNYIKMKNNGLEPNLTFHYDTLADDEGHAFNKWMYKNEEYRWFYSSKVLSETLSVYADEYNQIVNSHKNDDNYLILQIIDHGRNTFDNNHSPSDPAPHRVFMMSNQDLKKYDGGVNDDEINQSSIKEIIWNFLQKRN